MPALAIDDRATVWSAGQADRTDRPLLVLLHGFGSDESDLFSMSPYLPLAPVIASLRAPFTEGNGFAWFPRTSASGGDGTDPAAADAAAQAVLDWLDTSAGSPTSVGLLGFSQGAAVSLQLLRLAPERFDYVVALSGFIPVGEHDGDAALATARPAVFWGRGTEDHVISADAIARTGEWMTEHALADVRVYEGMAHSVSGTELADVSGFIRAR